MKQTLLAIFKHLLLLTFALLLGGIVNVYGANRTASVSGNWNNTATWGNNPVPTSNDVVIINDNINVSVNVAAICSSLTINAGANSNTLTISLLNSLTVSGAVTINAGSVTGKNKIIAVGAGTFSCASITIANTLNDGVDGEVTLSTGTIIVSGIITMNGSNQRNAIRFLGAGTLNAGGSIIGGDLISSTGTVNYNAAGSQTIGGYNYNNLTLSGSGTKTLQTGTISIGGNLTIDNVTTSAVTGLSIGGDVILERAFSFASGDFTHNVGGNWTINGWNSFAPTVGTINFTGNNSVINGTTGNMQSFNNITVSKSAGQSLSVGGSFTTLTLTNDLTLTSGNFAPGTAATILSGNWTNNGGALTLGTGVITMKGSGKTIGGSSSTTFNNLTINNNVGGILLGRAQIVNGTLTLSNGLLKLGSYNLTLGASAPAITGPFWTANMIVADGTGELRKIFTGNGSYTFPIGDGSSNLSPITLNFTSGVYSAGAYAAVRVTDAKHPNNTNTNNYLSRYWTVSQSGISTFSCNISGTYIYGSDIVGQEDQQTASQYTSSNSWVLYSTLSGGTLSATGVTSFGDFTGTETLSISIGSMISSCCAGSLVSVPFSVKGAYLSGNVFTAQLSNSTGNFGSPVTIGTITSINSGTISATIPISTIPGTGYRIRVVSNNPAITGTDNGTNITVNSIPSAPATTGSLICIGSNATLSASGAVTGEKYKWYDAAVNGNLLYTSTDNTNNVYTTAVLVATTNFWVSKINAAGCEGSRTQVVATYPTASADNQNLAGTNSWIGHVYDGTNNGVAYNGTFTNYYGSFAEAETFNQSFGGDANCFSFTSNSIARSIYTDGFSVRYRMSSTKKGFYIADLGSDDGGRLTVDGTMVYNNWADQGYVSRPRVLMSLNGASSLVYDFYEGWGGNQVVFQNLTLVLSNTLITNVSQGICMGNSGSAISGNIYGTLPVGVSLSGTGYQWTYSTTLGGARTAITGATAENFIPNTVGAPFNAAGTYYIFRNAILSSANNIAPNPYVATNESNAATITVNPTPVITAMTSTICSAGSFSVTPVNTTNGIVPSATTYSWPAPVVTGGLTGGVSGSAASGITGTLTNPTNTAQTATYTVTPLSGSCTGSTFTVTVTVSPKPSVTAMSSTICSAGGFSVTPVNTTNGIVPSPTTYSWPAPMVTGGLTGGVSGSAASGMTGTLTNPTNTAQTAIYTVTPLSGSCTGSTFTVTITVSPKPAVTAMSSTICSAGSFSVTPVNNTNGIVPSATTYSWLAPVVTGGLTGGVSGSAASGITGTLTNPTNTAQTATYTVTPLSGSCTGSTFTVTITVNPNLPVSITIAPTANPVCAGTSVTFTATPINGGTTPIYQWKLNGVNVGTNGPIYTTTALANNDIVTCLLTSNATCATGNPATSNAITMTVYSLIDNNIVDNINGVHGVICATVNENATAVLTAPTGSIFTNVIFASYGTPNGICPTFTLGACHALTSQSVSETYLLGKNVASIPAANGVFGDPCSGTGKRLYILATYTEPICSGSTPGMISGGLPTGGNGTFTYLWESSITNSTSGFATASGTTNLQNYTPGALTQSTWYRRTVVSGACSNVSTVLLIKVSPVIGGNTIGSAQTICSGSTPSALTGALPTGGSSTYVYTWESSTTNATTGFLAIGTSDSQNYTPAALTQTTWYRRKVTSGGCNSTSTAIQITVSPVPAIAAKAATTCSGTLFTVSPANGTDIVPTGTTYSWSAPVATGITGQVAGTNASNISGTLTNTTNAAINIIYTVTPLSGSCTGSTFTVTVTVNPKPAVTNMTSTICSAGSFTVIPVNTTNGIVPTGTTYSWSAPVVTGALTGGVSGSTASSITGTLTNPTNAAQTATYTVMPTLGSCTGSSFTVTVTVSPKAGIANKTATTCSGTLFTVSPANGTDIVPTGTTYSWSAPVVTGGLTGGVSSSTASSITGTLTNPTNAAQTATYTVMPTSGSCTGSSFTVTVTVSPKAGIANKTATTCSGTLFTVSPANGTDIVPALTTYSWPAPVATGITGQVAGTNAANISGTLINTTNAAINIIYTVTPLSASCTGSSFTVTVTVNPSLPVSISISGSANSVCSGTSVIFSATPMNGGLTPAYQWKVNNINVGTNSSTYSYIPLNNDVVTCLLTSNVTCATGSPATSNTVTMIVNQTPSDLTVISVNPASIGLGASEPIVLSASGGGVGTLKWYTGSCGSGASIGSGTPLSIPHPLVTTTYYARWETGTCNSNCLNTTVTVTANSLIYRSKISGNWDVASTWERSADKGETWSDASATPTNTDGSITIRVGHTVTVTASVTVDECTVNAGGQVTINPGQTVSIAEGATNIDFSVDGTIVNAGTIVPTGSLYFNSGSSYTHTRDGGAIPTAIWNATSNCNITGIIGATTLSGLGQTFGNFTWNCAGQTSTLYINTNINIAGNFTVSGTGGADASNHSLRMSSTGTEYTMDVTGNVLIDNYAAFKMNNSSGPCILKIGGDFTIKSGNFTLNTGTANATVKVTGNVNILGGTIVLTEDHNDFNGTMNIQGNFTQSGGLITILNAGTTDIGTINFNGTNQTYQKTAGTFSKLLNFTVNSGSTLNLGTSFIDGSEGTFTLSAGAGIITAHTEGLSTTGLTGNIQVAGVRTYDITANYTYNGILAQVTGDGLPSVVNNLTISNAAGVTINAVTTVTNNLSITSGSVANLQTFNHSAGTLTLGGVGTALGSWGSTSSAATNKNNTYFAATTGIVNIGTSTCTTPSTPLIGTITQPTCTVATGSVVLNGLPTGNWTLNPGAITGSGTSATISGLSVATYNFKVTSSTGCISDASADVVINTQPTTTINSQSTGGQTVCLGGTFTAITVTTTGVTGYQWYSNTAPSVIGATSLGSGNGAQTNSYTPQSSTAGTLYYYCIVTGACGPITSAFSGAFIVNPNLPVSVTIAASANPACIGSSVTFTATPTNGGTAPAYQWKVNNVIKGTNSATLAYVPVNVDIVICVLTSNASPCSSGSPATSNVLNMTVNSIPSAPLATGSLICIGSTATLTASGAVAGDKYKWYDAVTGGNLKKTSSSNTDNNYITATLGSTTNYWVSILSAGGCESSRTPVTATYPAASTDDQNLAGTDSWIGHLYDGVNFNTYYGSFIEAEAIDNNFGGDNVCFSVNSSLGSRSVYTATYSVRYRMNSSKSGLYVVNLGSDDGSRLTVDGTLLCNNWSDQSFTSRPRVLMSLNGASSLVYDFYESGGGNRVVFLALTQVLANTLATNVSQSICMGNPGSAISGDIYGTLPVGITLSGTGYQWAYSSTLKGTRTNITGATAATFTPDTNVAPFNVAGTYYIFRNAVLSSTNNVSPSPYVSTHESNAATIIVNALPTATFTSSMTVCQNSAPPVVTFYNPGDFPITITLYVESIHGDYPVNVAANLFTDVAVPTGDAGSFIATNIRVSYQTEPTCTQTLPGSITVTIIPDGSWTGAIDTDWNNPGNWACNKLPTIVSNVLIANGKPNYPTISSGEVRTANNLTIEDAASLTITGNTLQIAGVISNLGTFTATSGTIEMKGSAAQSIGANVFAGNTIKDLAVNNSAGVTLQGALNVTGIVKAWNGDLTSGGNLTLVSTSAQTALIDGTGTGQVLGIVNMERYLPSAFGYKYFSSPFQSATVAEFGEEVKLDVAFPAFYKYDENNSAVSSSGVTIYPTGWVTYTNPTNSLFPLSGYSANLGSNIEAAPITANIKGVVNNGSLQTTLYNHNRPYTKGFNLVGNPYPSPIDWNATGWTKTNIDNAIYFFNANSTQFSGAYSSYVNGVSSGNANNMIAAMQGFFVHVTNGTFPVSATLGVINSVRVNNLNPVFKNASIDNRAILRFTANFETKDAIEDAAVIYFDQTANLRFDQELDALKMTNTDPQVPNIYTLTPETTQLSINGMPLPTDSLASIGLGITTFTGGWIILKAIDISQLPDYLQIYLVDTETGKQRDLKRLPDYRFFMKTGEYNHRFTLIFSRGEIIEPTVAGKMFTLSRSGDFLQVKANLPTNTKGSLLVTNILGQTIIRKVVFENETVKINQNVSTGVYVITLISGKNTYSEKIIMRKDNE